MSIVYKIFRELVDNLMDLFMDNSPSACNVEHANQETCYSLDHKDPCDHCAVLIKLGEIDTLLEKLA